MKRFLPHLILLIVAILAYGLLIPQLGFYWDDLPMSWIRYQLGSEALTRYFSTNRPVWGMLYQLTTSVIPHEPIYWQIFALFWRWLGAVTVFAIVEKMWKDKPRVAFSVALLFLVYPGFTQQWSAFLYSHFFIVLFFFLYSILCMLRAIDEPNKYGRWTLRGILFSVLNLWMMEYFYVLELMRVGVILTALRGETMSLRERIIKTFKLWLPYLFVFVLAVLSRLFIFNNQVYGIGLGDQLRSAPLATMIELVRSIRFTLVLVLRDAWVHAIQLPALAVTDPAASSYFIVFGAAILFAIIGFLLLPRDASQVAVSRLEDVLSAFPGEQNLRADREESPRPRRSLFAKGGTTNNVFLLNFKRSLQDGAWAIGLGLFAVLLAGWPFWLIGFTPSLAWPASRFTLPFMLGIGLIFTGVAMLIPWQTLRYLLLALLVGFGVGRQFVLANEYKQDWETQKNLFWQMTWRAPGIQPDTAIIMNEGGLKFYADNSLSPVVNWVYAPDEHDDQIEYVLLYPTSRLRSDALPKLEPDLPIFTNYLAGTFSGNTSQALAMYFAPPACLRVLDPEIDRLNRTIPEQSLMRFAARLSNPDLISSEQTSRMPDVYGPEPEHGWCYFFQQAELARQINDWDQVVALGDAALQLERPSDEPAELFVFIEGYAHAGDWVRAIELSRDAYQASPEIVGEMLCRLWERVEVESTSSEESDALSESKRSEALATVVDEFKCDS
jgi:hypothetical protein